MEDEARNAVNPPTCQWQSRQAGRLVLPWASGDHQYNMHDISMASEFTCMISVLFYPLQGNTVTLLRSLLHTYMHNANH